MDFAASRRASTLKLPAAFTAVPDPLLKCNLPASDIELQQADSVRKEYLISRAPQPYMADIVRGFRLAEGAKVYVEVGSQDKGNIAWLARTKLGIGATIIDIDFNDYPANDRKIAAELADNFDYHSIRGDCLADETIEKLKAILAGRKADIIFCDSFYTYAHTIHEFSLYFPLVRHGGHLLFHDAQWRGNPSLAGSEGEKGKALAIEQLDRFYPAYMVVGSDTPLHRPLPTPHRGGNWGSLAVFAA